MGQRHQYIVNFPAKNYGADNPNNRGPLTQVIHHQWLFGANAIFTLDRVLTLVKNVTADKDYLFGTDEKGYSNGDGINAIGAAISIDPKAGYYHNVHIFEKSFDAQKPLMADHLDNNDGVTVIQFEAGKKKPLVCFATPNHIEGSHWNHADGQHGPFTPAEYLAFYYNAKEQAAWNESDTKAIGRALRNIAKNSRPMTSDQLKALLPTWKF